jgi:hypothetical protein
MLAAHSFVIPSVRQLQQHFVDVLPRIERYARFYFRHIRCPVRRDELIAETVALAWQWFTRLMQRGKDALRFISRLACLAARAVKCGRRLVGMETSRDVLSKRARRHDGFSVESLPAAARTVHEELYSSPHGQKLHDAFEERLRDNPQRFGSQHSRHGARWLLHCR